MHELLVLLLYGSLVKGNLLELLRGCESTLLAAARGTPGIRSVELDSSTGKVLILGNTREAVSKARDKLELQETQIDIPAAQSELVKSNISDIKTKSGVQECQLVGSGSAGKVRIVGTRVAVNVARSILEAQIKYARKMKGLANGTQLDAIVAQTSTPAAAKKPAPTPAPAPVASGPERRKADDGQFYTKEEFQEYYGGLNEWSTAEVEKPKAAPARAGGSSTSAGSSGAANGQVQFTREAFIAAFGDDKEFLKYERLKGKGILPHWYREHMSEKLKAATGASSTSTVSTPAPTPAPVEAPKPVAAAPAQESTPPKPVEPKAPAEPEKRMADDGCLYTKEEFIEFFGGTTEWDAATPETLASNGSVEKSAEEPTPAAVEPEKPTPEPTPASTVTETVAETTTPAHAVDTETNGASEPQTELQKLFARQQELVKDDPSFRYENPSRTAATASSAGGPSGPEKRLSEDGTAFTKEEFVEFYGGTTEWDAAPIAESSNDYGAGGASSGERCYSWTQGTCRWGDRCKFVHEGEGGCIETGQNIGPCYDFQAGTCTRGSSCKFSHDEGGGDGGGLGGGRDVCYDFQNGSCTRGDSCRFSHGDSGGGGLGGGGDGEERRIAPDGSAYTKAEFIEFYEGTTEWDAAEAAPATDGGGGGNDYGNDYGGGGDRCYDWTQYRCRWGDTCKYSHDGEGGVIDPQEARKMNGICYQWQSGECFRGDSCKFAHEGEAGGGGGGGGDGGGYGYGEDNAGGAAGGNSGGEEKRIAPDGNAYTKAEFEEFYGGEEEWNNGSPAPATEGGGGGGGGGYEAQPACYDWSQYACRFGDTCKFSHDGEGGPLPIEEIRKTTGVCYQWQEEGSCRFGDNCRFNHTGGENDPAAANASSADEEKRTSPDGNAYTKQEFIDFYGGTDEWDAAAPPPSTPLKASAEPESTGDDEVAEAAEDEKRVAPDGESYTKEEFLEFYGGTKEWDDAKPTGGLPKVAGEGQASLKEFDSMLENGKLSVDEYAEKVAKLDSPHTAA